MKIKNNGTKRKKREKKRCANKNNVPNGRNETAKSGLALNARCLHGGVANAPNIYNQKCVNTIKIKQKKTYTHHTKHTHKRPDRWNEDLPVNAPDSSPNGFIKSYQGFSHVFFSLSPLKSKCQGIKMRAFTQMSFYFRIKKWFAIKDAVGSLKWSKTETNEKRREKKFVYNDMLWKF